MVSGAPKYRSTKQGDFRGRPSSVPSYLAKEEGTEEGVEEDGVMLLGCAQENARQVWAL